ncbi:MAG TPA: polyketide synthase [Chitinophaga sp.]|uniref:polyketide synthase n=1 Tax=Chitinophaga sp. TaxID=1869181 RepID=UPI002C3D8287|nr:polyketide synthase [Chitinophaga sp.]HVI46506.1 polyketide synthase [Chitinophaga sp.]
MEPVIDLTEVKPGIVQITMQEKEHRNLFTPRLLTALEQAFNAIHTNNSYKVVIITGYGNYFASGGTEESLLAIYRNEASFADVNLHRLLIECRLPVIAAMQGHAMGGGLAFGMYADFVILGKESVYTANFMKYGFTPGMGVTCILPHKLGWGLATEMLMSAGKYRGSDLEKRGIPFSVLPRAEVLAHAYQLASEMVDMPLASLILLKTHLNGDLKAKLAQCISREMEMHAITFHLPEVRERIISLFGQQKR